MSGAPTPPAILQAFGASAVNINVIPDAASPTPGLASYSTGFPPINFQEIPAGGIAPDGGDFNGILNAVSAYALFARAGQTNVFNAALATALSGYAAGAIVASASVAGRYFYNVTAGNTNDPDVTPTGWVPFSPATGAVGYQAAAPAAGTTNDFALTDGCSILDLTPAGASTITGFAGGVDGQRIIVTNIHATNVLTLSTLTGSAAGNQLRLAANLSLIHLQTQAFQYTKGPATAVWVPL